jgi:hypothetical protein
MKLCKDCTHYSPHRGEEIPGYRAMCMHDKARTGEFYVTGDNRLRFSCAAMREGICGTDAKLWEPRYEQNEEVVPGATGTSSLART